MIHGDDRKDTHLADDQEEAKLARPIVLGKLKTDEERRLAREIEDLRGQPPRTEGDEDA